MATQSAPVRAQAIPRSRGFYVAMGLVCAAFVFFGFARTYYLKSLFGTPSLPLLLHLHGLVMSTWLALFIVQGVLVAAHRVRLHRQLGLAGGVLAAVVVAIGPIVALRSARLGHAPPGVPPLAFLAVPLTDMVVFAILITAAFYHRRRPELHKRLMLVATISIIPAGIARWPLAAQPQGPLMFFGIADLLLLGCIAYDYSRTRRLNPGFLWGGLLL